MFIVLLRFRIGVGTVVRFFFGVVLLFVFFLGVVGSLGFFFLDGVSLIEMLFLFFVVVLFGVVKDLDFCIVLGV